MNATSEGRALVLIVSVILGVGVGSSLAGFPGYIAAAGLLVAGLGWLTVGMVRRERRIRARLADPRTLPRPGLVPAGPVLSGAVVVGRGRGVA